MYTGVFSSPLISFFYLDVTLAKGGGGSFSSSRLPYFLAREGGLSLSRLLAKESFIESKSDAVKYIS